MITPKKDIVADTTKAYLYEIYDMERSGIKEVLSTKEMRKGIECEQDSIDLINEVHGTFYTKNEEHRENDWISGTPDIVHDVIVDAKTAWSAKTFRRASLTKNNYWQMIGYLWLWDKPTGYDAYTLVNTPEEMILDAQRSLSWQMGMIDDNHPEYVAAARQIEKNMTFDHIPVGERVNCFRVDYFEEKVSYMKERIAAAREFLAQIDREVKGYGRISPSGQGKATPLPVGHQSVEARVGCVAFVVADIWNVLEDSLMVKRGSGDEVLAKHQFRVVLRDIFSSYSSMATYLGVTHATIIHSFKKHKDYLSYDKAYRFNFEKIREAFSEQPC